MSGAAVVNSNINLTQGVGTASITLTIGTLSNAIAVVVFRDGSSANYINSISGPVGSWASARGTIGNSNVEIQPGSSTYYMSSFLGYANATGSQTITVTIAAGTQNIYLWAAEVSGIASSGAILSSIGNHQSSAGPGTNAITVSGGTGSDSISTAPAFALCAVRCSGTGTLTPGTGFTQLQYNNPNRQMFESAPITATGTFDSTVTNAGAANNAFSFQLALLQSNQTSYAFVQDSAACSSSAVTTLSTPAVNVTAGDWLFAVLWGNGQSASAAPTDGPGDTFSLLGTTGSGKLQVYACPSALGGSTSVTFNVSGATNIQVYMAEYSGLGASIGNVLGTSNTSSKSGTNVTPTAINVTSVPAILWSFLMDASSDATAPVVAGAMTARAAALWACNSPNDLNAIGDQLVTVSGNTSGAFVIGNTNDTIHVFSAAISLASATPQTPPLTQLFNRRQQLYFA